MIIYFFYSRHCGRLLCNKCSSKEMPIIKYNLSKAVRVCDTCAEVITVGPAFSWKKKDKQDYYLVILLHNWDSWTEVIDRSSVGPAFYMNKLLYFTFTTLWNNKSIETKIIFVCATGVCNKRKELVHTYYIF